MSRRSLRGTTLAWCVAGLLCSAAAGHAIDNPDSPERVAPFEARCREFEAVIETQAETTAQSVQAYAAFERFLVQQLDEAYQRLLLQLDPGARASLSQSQTRWQQYRDAEFAFIAGNWTREQFGTSAMLSRGAYRTGLIKQRVLQLLGYSANYPDPGKP